MKKISKLLIGTNNKGKYKEIKDLLPKYIKTHSTSEFKFKSPREDGMTFTSCFPTIGPVHSEVFHPDYALFGSGDSSFFKQMIYFQPAGSVSSRFCFSWSGAGVEIKMLSWSPLLSAN